MKSNQHSSVRAILYAFLANLGIFITKLITAIFTNSGSMMAEAIHSLADSLNQILLYVGLKRSERKPDKIHPLGYGKAIYVWSFLVAIILFSMGGIFSVYEGIHKIKSPSEVKSLEIGLIVLGISILLELFSFFGAMREVNIVKKNQSFWYWLKTSKTAELIVVIGEDIAAVLGLIIAFIFVFLSYFFNNPLYDAIGTIIIGLLLLVISFFISIRVKSMMIGESTLPEIEEEIRNIIQKSSNVKEILNMITLHLGKNIMLAAKIKLNQNLTMEEAINEINRIEEELQNKIPDIQWSFLEPDYQD